MNEFFQFLEKFSTAINTAIIGALVIAFAKAIVRIFRMGATFKGDMASKEDLSELRKEVKGDMRAYATNIQKSVLDATMKVIDHRLANIDQFSETATEMKVLKVEIEGEVKRAIESADENKALGDTVRSLTNRVTRLEYGDGNKTERRTEK